MEEPQWYVLRDLSRVHAANPGWRQLADKGLRVFTPLQERILSIAGRRVRRQVAVIPDLLFVCATPDELDPLIESTPTLQYRYVKGAPYRTAMTVPTAQMQQFIAAVEASPSTTYYLPDEITPDMVGRPVRIIDGPLAGAQGRLLKLRGSSKRRMLISLDNMLSAAVEVEKNFIELI